MLIRPLSAFFYPTRKLLNATQRGLLGGGIRGIGSLYYLFYSINHGLPTPSAVESTHLVLSVVALSILAHGVTVQPMLVKYESAKAESVPGA